MSLDGSISNDPRANAKVERPPRATWICRACIGCESATALHFFRPPGSFGSCLAMSAFPPIATAERTSRDVSNVPTSDIPRADRLNKSRPWAQSEPPVGGSQFNSEYRGSGGHQKPALASDDGPRSRTMISKGPRLPGFFCPPQPGTSHPCKDRSPLPCAILYRL